MNDDDATRCPLTLDWVRQANDAEAGNQLSLFDLLYIAVPSADETFTVLDVEARWAMLEQADDQTS